jgi:hypothetical protein
MNGFSNGRRRTQSQKDDRRPRRIKQCEACKKKNVLALRESEGQAFYVRCSNCGEYPGIVSSYRPCPHDPVHRYDEAQVCEKQKVEAQQSRKRRKEVFPTDEIPHLWMHAWRSQGNARNAGGNLYFQQASIFSYGSHFEIARHVETKRGDAVLFNTATYSVTTTRQQSSVRSAIPDSVTVFNVVRLDVPDAGRFAGDTHAVNIKDYDSRVESALLKAIRARSSYAKESNHEDAVKTRAERNAYAVFFGLRIKPLASVPALDSKVIDAIKAKEAERVRVESEKTKQAKAERLRQMAESIEAWKQGQSVSLGYDAPTMLRINGAEVETSKGARVPLSHAKRALTLVRAVVARGETWETNGHTCHVGHYKIERIEANGTIKAGCHVIPRDEWERIAPAIEASTAVESEQQQA